MKKITLILITVAGLLMNNVYYCTSYAESNNDSVDTVDIEEDITELQASNEKDIIVSELLLDEYSDGETPQPNNGIGDFAANDGILTKETVDGNSVLHMTNNSKFAITESITEADFYVDYTFKYSFDTSKISSGLLFAVGGDNGIGNFWRWYANGYGMVDNWNYIYTSDNSVNNTINKWQSYRTVFTYDDVSQKYEITTFREEDGQYINLKGDSKDPSGNNRDFVDGIKQNKIVFSPDAESKATNAGAAPEVWLKNVKMVKIIGQIDTPIIFTSSLISKTDVPLNTKTITLTANKELDGQYINSDNIILKKSNGESVLYDVELINENTISVEISSLDKLTEYTLTVSTNVVALDKSELENEYKLIFTTENTVISIRECSVDNMTDISVNIGQIEFLLLGKLDMKSMNKDNITICKNDNDKIDGEFNISYNPETDKILMTFGQLDEMTQYTVRIKNLYGITYDKMKNEYVKTFKTGRKSVVSKNDRLNKNNAFDLNANGYFATWYENDGEPYMHSNYLFATDEATSNGKELYIDYCLRVRGGQYANASLVLCRNSNGDKMSDVPIMICNGGESLNFVYGNNILPKTDDEKITKTDDWMNIRLSLNKSEDNTYIMSFYIANENGVYKKITKDYKTGISQFDRLLFGGNPGTGADVKSIAYNISNIDGEIPKVIGYKFTDDAVYVDFNIQMRENLFAENVMAYDENGIEIQDVSFNYNNRRLVVAGEKIKRITLLHNISSIDGMMLADDFSVNKESSLINTKIIGFTDVPGGDIKAPQRGGTVTTAALLENISEEDITVTIFNVLCDKNRIIKRFKYYTAVVPAGEERYFNCRELTLKLEEQDGDYIKTFILGNDLADEFPIPLSAVKKVVVK